MHVDGKRWRGRPKEVGDGEWYEKDGRGGGGVSEEDVENS